MLWRMFLTFARRLTQLWVLRARGGRRPPVGHRGHLYDPATLNVIEIGNLLGRQLAGLSAALEIEIGVFGSRSELPLSRHWIP